MTPFYRPQTGVSDCLRRLGFSSSPRAVVCDVSSAIFSKQAALVDLLHTSQDVIWRVVVDLGIPAPVSLEPMCKAGDLVNWQEGDSHFTGVQVFKVERAHFAALKKKKGPENRKNEVKLRPPSVPLPEALYD